MDQHGEFPQLARAEVVPRDAESSRHRRRWWHLLPPVLVAVTATALTTSCQPPPSFIVVRPGMTVSSIASTYGLRAADVEAWNGLARPFTIYPDEVLRLTAPSTPLPPFVTRVETVTAPGSDVNWRPGCPTPLSALRRVWVTYLDYDGNAHQGSLVVNAALAPKAQGAFRTLYARRFRIRAMEPIPANAPGTPASAATTAYNCRVVAGTTAWSQHALGNAIDVNPVENPLLDNGKPSNLASQTFVDRSQYRLGMVHATGAARAFTNLGVFWGGNWTGSRKDLMHFSPANR